MRTLDRLSEERIIYVNAPAGYGKTTAVRQWADGKKCAKAFVALDEYDNSALSFCERFCAALRACQPRNTALAQVISHQAFISAPEDYTLRAVASLSRRRRTVLLVDDLHYLQNEKILHLLLILLKRLPDSFQIVLISRGDLPSGFSDLWIKGSLARVTAEQLRFSGEEIERLYKNHGTFISAKEAKEISRFTGGWAIGIRALLLMGGELSGKSMEYLDDYILPSVWEKWDEPTREFLLSTALARKLNPSLCDALTGLENSESMLQELVRKGAFISQAKDGFYRFHRLFRLFLTRKLSERGEAYVHALYEREGQWHLSRRDFYSALDCFVKCESFDGIARCFELLSDSKHEYFFIEKLISAARVSLIDQIAENFPYIYSILSWVAFNDGRAADMLRYADLYYENYAEIVRRDPRRRFDIFLMRFVDFRFSLKDMLEASGGALSAISASGADESGFSVGIINQNMPLLHRGTRDFSECCLNGVELSIAAMRLSFGGLFGDSADLLMECLTAGLLYEQGQLEKAYAHALAAIAEINAGSAPEAEFFASVVLISVLDALGDFDSAQRRSDMIGEMIDRNNAYYLSHNYSALCARRRLANGDMNAASRWLAEHRDVLLRSVSFYELYVAFTTCRAYIAAGDYDAAIQLLSKLLELVTAYNRRLEMIEAQTLLAISYWKKKRGFQADAMGFLEDAVSMAYPFGYVQPFVNEGPELAGMMLRLQRSAEQRSGQSDVPVSFIKMLCLKMQESTCGGLTSGQTEPVAKFTDKQTKVMTLLCEGKSYREIAESMGIKLPTLRSHIALIYKKLDVTNVSDAVTKIRSYNIIS